MTAAYLLAFAVLQWPLGAWLDRHGPVRTESLLLLVAAIGCVLFATATSVAQLMIGRALIGAGVAACLMAPFKAYRMWFAAEKQGRLVSWMLLAGTSGAILASAPAHLLATAVGWRALFWITAGLLALAAAALWFVLPHGVGATAPAGTQPVRSLARMLVTRAVLTTAPAAVFVMGGYIALQTLWLGPWLRQVAGMSPQGAADALTLINAAMLPAYLLLGAVSPWLARHPKALDVVTFGAFLGAGLLMLAAGLLQQASPWWLWIGVAVLFTVQPIMQSRVTLCFAPHEAGRAATAINLLIFGGAFLLQAGIGAMVRWQEHAGISQSAALSHATWLLGAAMLLASLWGWFGAARAYPMGR
jgi:predicted MFS family arabinose efflux permease